MAHGDRSPGPQTVIMHLTDVERDKLLLSYAAEMAWRRHARGVKLKHPESIALRPWRSWRNAAAAVPAMMSAVTIAAIAATQPE